MGLLWKIVDDLIYDDPGLPDAVLRTTPVYVKQTADEAAAASASLGNKKRTHASIIDYGHGVADGANTETSRVGEIQIKHDEQLAIVHDCMATLYLLHCFDLEGLDFEPSPEYKCAPDGSRSMLALYNAWIKLIIDAFQHTPHLWVYWMCMDKGSPLQKTEEQQSRDDKNHGEPYPQDTVLDHDGVSFQIDESGQRHHQSVDVRRLMSTRWMRPLVFEYFRLQAMRDPRTYGLRFGMDYTFEAGPWVFANGKCREAPEFKNNKLEADLAAYDIALRMRHMHIWLKCRDRDLEEIGLQHAHRFQKSILFQQSPTELINLKYVAKNIKNLRAHLLISILCGNDYFKKATMFYQIGNDIIAKVTREHFEYWEKRGQPHRLPFDLAAFANLVRDIHKQANAARSDSRRVVPSLDMIREQHRTRICFCYVYWAGLQETYPVPVPHGWSWTTCSKMSDNVSFTTVKSASSASSSSGSSSRSSAASKRGAPKKSKSDTSKTAAVPAAAPRTAASVSSSSASTATSVAHGGGAASAPRAKPATAAQRQPTQSGLHKLQLFWGGKNPKKHSEDDSDDEGTRPPTKQTSMKPWTIPNTLPRPQHFSHHSTLSQLQHEQSKLKQQKLVTV